MERTELHEVLRLERVFGVAPEKVWRAWTDAEALRVWFGQSDAPDWAAELDVCVGGRYRLVLRHPEQWFWVHRRWKDVGRRKIGRRSG